jgi:hypothetical protein
MKFNAGPLWQFLLASAIPLVEGAGQSMEASTDPKQALIGEGLVFGGQFLQFLLDKIHGKPATAPALPASIYPAASTPTA